MKIGKHDWLFIGIIAAVIILFVSITGPEKTKQVPIDQNHQRFHDMIRDGKTKKDVDPLCAECHDGVKIRFPDNHPAKPGAGPMRCLFCHKIKVK